MQQNDNERSEGIHGLSVIRDLYRDISLSTDRPVLWRATKADADDSAQIPQVMAVIRNELTPHMQTLVARLAYFAEFSASHEMKPMVEALTLQVNRLNALVTVFGAGSVHWQ